jgi:xylulokinase
VLIPDPTELVALGAAAQAAAILGGESLESVGARWGTTAGTLLEPMPADHERLARIRAVVRSAAATPDLWGGAG